MNDLSSKANALVEMGRLGDEPTDAELSHNRSALAGKLGAAALGASAVVGTAKPAAAASVTTWTTAKVAWLCGAVVVGGAATWGIVQSGSAHGDAASSKDAAHSVAAQPAVEPPAPSVVETPEPHAAPEEPAQPEAPAPPASVQRAPATSKAAGAPSTPSIGDELKLVRGAQQHLNRGEPAAALQLLSEHARRFPSGVLWEEREASRVLALCSMGQGDAARARADAFIKRVPHSPFVDRVRAACRGADPSGSH